MTPTRTAITSTTATPVPNASAVLDDRATTQPTAILLPTGTTVPSIYHVFLASVRSSIDVASVLHILFAFDPRRAAICLIGADKQGQWMAWDEQTVPGADQLYDDYLEELRKEEV